MMMPGHNILLLKFLSERAACNLVRRALKDGLALKYRSRLCVLAGYKVSTAVRRLINQQIYDPEEMCKAQNVTAWHNILHDLRAYWNYLATTWS